MCHARSIALGVVLLSLAAAPAARTALGQSAPLLTGSLQVHLGPAEAVAAGARWRTGGGAWQASGSVLSDLTPGPQTIDLSPAPGWIEPGPRQEIVVGAAATQVAIEYLHLPAYYFRAVPSQLVRHGDALRVRLLSSDPGDPESPAPGTLVVDADPFPVGPFTYAAGTQELRYQPDRADRTDFTVTITSGAVVGQFLVTPVPALPPEDGAIHFRGATVDPQSRDHVRIREAPGAAPERFNSGEHITRQVSISGAWLLFEAGSTVMDLHDRFSGDETIKEMALYAERITIRSPLLLPQTRLTIHARELRFEGQGHIDVTPRPPLSHLEPAAGDGANGLDAAPMVVLVERFFADATRNVRFVGRGTKGQPPNPGADGPDGPVAPGTPTCGEYLGHPIVYSYCVTGPTTITVLCGSPTVHGAAGIAAGRPGDGGSGASFWSTLDLARYTDLAGGPTGDPGPAHVGGLPTCYVMSLRGTKTEPCSQQAFGLLEGQRGSPSAATHGAAGKAGEVRRVSDRGSWLHPILLEGLLLFIKDQYLAGQLAEARDRLTEYAACLRALKADPPEGGTVIADSRRDWSTSGEQGHASWYYGYSLRPKGSKEDPRGIAPPGGRPGGLLEPYLPQDLTLFDRAAHWTGAKWDLLNAEAGPWTEIGQEATHPNGPNSPPQRTHWTVRRWVSDHGGPATLRWHLRKTNLAAGGNGVTGHLFLNGARVDGATLAFNDGTGVERAVEVMLTPGDLVDLALSPTGTDGEEQDGGDGSANWLQVIAAPETRFAQLEEEIETLLYRLDSNLDYFGNPASWVPMLSFEANLAAFTQEIERAIPVLYLAYWIEKAAEKAIDTRDAMAAAKEKAADAIDSALAAYEAAREEMPRLTAQGEELTVRKDQLEQSLLRLQEALLRQAEENVADRHKVPFWRRAVGILGAVAKVIPAAQPVLGGIGVGLDAISRFDPDRPVESLERLPSLVKAVLEKDYTLCQKETEEEDEEEDEENDGEDATESSLERLKRCAKLLAPAAREIRGILKASQAPRSEIQAELEKLRAQEPRFADITRQLAELNEEKQLFSERLAAAMEAITRFSTIVTQGLKTIDELDRNLDQALDVLDHQALISVAAMGQAARDRLLRYQYLMAKAYQYRIVKPYGGSFHLGELLDNLQQLVEFHDADHLLAAQDFDDLKAIYLDELSRLADGMLTDLNLEAPERSAPVSFQLSSDELAALNETGSVAIDLGRRRIFGQSQENLRIVDLRVADASRVRIDGALGGTASLRLDLEHAGVSQIVNDGVPYAFTHYRTERSNPIRWGAVYDGLGGRWTQTSVSYAAQSLIRFLLGLQAGDADGILLYSRPGALAEVVITQEVVADTGVRMTLERLVLELEYDYAERDPGERLLEVDVADELQPIITVDEEDENGRRDGRGAFTRRYAGARTVRLQAPATHGVWKFERWEDGADPDDGGEIGFGGAILGTTPALEVSLAADRAVRAVYSTVDGPGGTVFRRGDSTGDGEVNISDAIKILAFLFTGGAPLSCDDATDANDDGSRNISDAITILSYLFSGTATIPAPGPEACGVDPTADGLDCAAGGACP